MIVTQTLQTMLSNLSIYTSPKNFNGELGMSLSIFQIENYTPSPLSLIRVFFKTLTMSCWSKQPSPRVLVLEYGIDHPGEMDFLLSIVKPDCAIHTQIDAVHSEQFGNPDNIAKEEFLLVQNTRDVVFLNTDDPYAKDISSTIACDILTYSATGVSDNTTLTLTEKNTAIDDFFIKKNE